MNHWTDLSIKLAARHDYLDQLFKVYPLVPEVIRDVDQAKWLRVEQAYQRKDKKELIRGLLALELFPIKDSYIAHLRRDKGALDRNPATVDRIVDRLYAMGLEEIWRRASEPKETNRQIGPLFRKWINTGALGVDILDKEDFLATAGNAVLKGADTFLKQFAIEHLNYTNDKGIDLIAKFNGTYVIGEAKFLTDFGGHQDRQLADAINLLQTEGVKAVKVAILDGVLYIPNKGSMHRMLSRDEDYNIVSSLLLKEFLFHL